MTNLSIGQKLFFIVEPDPWDYFLSTKYEPCEVTNIYDDHVIATTDDGFRLWIDEGTVTLFCDLRKKPVKY